MDTHPVRVGRENIVASGGERRTSRIYQPILPEVQNIKTKEVKYG